MKTGIELIAEERRRQIEKEGYTALHDSHHDVYDFLLAAIAYAEAAKVDASGVEMGDCEKAIRKAEMGLHIWPFGDGSFKPTTCERDIIKSAALLAAALDLLLAKSGNKTK